MLNIVSVCTEIITCHDDNLLSARCLVLQWTVFLPIKHHPEMSMILTYHILISIAFKFVSQSYATVTKCAPFSQTDMT